MLILDKHDMYRIAELLSSHIQAKRHDVRIEHRGVERCNEQIQICKYDSHSTINNTISAIHKSLWLERIPTIIARQSERAVRQIQLLRPTHELGCTSAGGGHIAVIRTDGLAWCVPLEEHFLTWEGEGFGFVMADGGTAAVADVGDVLAATRGEV